MRLIPSMDLLGGQVVRLLKGERKSAFVYPTAPEAWVRRLVEAGARRIHLVDLDAAFGEAPQQALRGFARAWPGVRFQLGGGLRSREAVERVQDDGFEAVVGTLALEQPEALAGLDPKLTDRRPGRAPRRPRGARLDRRLGPVPGGRGRAAAGPGHPAGPWSPTWSGTAP